MSEEIDMNQWIRTNLGYADHESGDKAEDDDSETREQESPMSMNELIRDQLGREPNEN